MNRLATAAIAAACGGGSACLFLTPVPGSPGAAALLLLGGPEGLQATLRDIVGRALDHLTEGTLPDRDRVAATLAAIIPGVAAASWMVMAVINAALAQGLLARFGLAWRPSPDL